MFLLRRIGSIWLNRQHCKSGQFVEIERRNEVEGERFRQTAFWPAYALIVNGPFLLSY